MYRSLVVNLVLLNALLGVAGCSRAPEEKPPLFKDDNDELWGDDKKDNVDPENSVNPEGKDDKKDEKKDEKKDGTHRSHTSSGRSGYRPVYIPRGGSSYMQRSSPRTQPRPSTGTVGRGGFGSTGRSVSS